MRDTARVHPASQLSRVLMGTQKRSYGAYRGRTSCHLLELVEEVSRSSTEQRRRKRRTVVDGGDGEDVIKDKGV